MNRDRKVVTNLVESGRNTYSNLDKDILKIAIILRPNNQAPPLKYDSCGRVVTPLINGLIQRGHDVTLYTAKPSTLECKIIQIPGIITKEYEGKMDISTHCWATYASQIFDDIKKQDYDIIHNHDDPIVFIFGRDSATPILNTLHCSSNDATLSCFSTYPDENFSAVSFSHRKGYPEDMNFVGVVYNSISDDHPFSKNKLDYLFSISRIQPKKGQKNAIEISKKIGLDLIIAGNTIDKHYFDIEIMPNVDIDLSRQEKEEERKSFIENISEYQAVGNTVTYIGEVTEQERDQVMKHAKAFLFPIEWEEPFGLVLGEAGIVGTPVIAFKRGAIPEIIVQGKTGFYGDSIDELIGYVRRVDEIKPEDCRSHVLKNFNVNSMVNGYLDLYKRIIEEKRSVDEENRVLELVVS